MMHRMGRIKQCLAAGLLVMLLLGGCSSASNDSYADSELPLEEEEEGQEEAAAQQLEQQLIAMLNLNNDGKEQVESDPALQQAASFYLEYVLQDPEKYMAEDAGENYMETFLRNKYIYPLVCDGSLSAVQVGEKALLAMEFIEKNPEEEEKFAYKDPKNIAVACGEGENGSVWVVLIFYAVSA